MFVQNKSKSREMIERLNLNRLQEKSFKRGDEREVEKFIYATRADQYSIRDKAGSGGRFLYAVNKNKVIKETKHYDYFSLNPSLKLADEEHLVLQGDIMIESPMRVLATLSDVRGLPLRWATENPKYSLDFNLLRDSEPRIKGLRYVIDYLFIHELFDVVVEFTLYNIPVGIHGEPILIWELRNY